MRAGRTCDGLRRTNADKRQAVTKLLGDEEWRGWSDSEIARRCRVSDHLVATMREALAPVHLREVEDAPRKVSCGGKTYTQKTGNVGKSRKKNGDAEEINKRPHSDTRTFVLSEFVRNLFSGL